MKDFVLAADLGGTNLRMALVSNSGEIINRVKIETPGSGSRHEIVDGVARAARECLAASDVAASALSLALPGSVHRETGKISKAPNLPELEGFVIGAAIESKIGMPVVLENDGNAAAIGEHWRGASKNSDSSIMITLGTGVGGGIIVGGEIVRGIDGTAGEIGHVCVEPEGHSCGCGSRGCIEQYSSATAIANMARRSSEANQAIAGLNGSSIDSEFVYREAMSGARWAQEIFETQGYYLGIVLAGLINCLNPEVIVIGGGMAAAWDAFMPSVTEQIGIRAYKEPAARASVVPAKLGDNAGILGAAKLGFENVKARVDVIA